MSIATSGALKSRRVRYVRDAEDRIIEIRQFDSRAQLNDYCFTIKIKRDPVSKSIISFWSIADRVNQDDVDATS